MVAESVRVTREELYEQVWSEPMQKLAKKYGISDVGLAKTCRRMRVPLLGRGYWAKKQFGKSVRRIPLPKLPASAASGIRDFVIRKPTSPPLPTRQPLGRLPNKRVSNRTMRTGFRWPIYSRIHIHWSHARSWHFGARNRMDRGISYQHQRVSTYTSRLMAQTG
jgi:hypothetical protein